MLVSNLMERSQEQNDERFIIEVNVKRGLEVQ